MAKYTFSALVGFELLNFEIGDEGFHIGDHISFVVRVLVEISRFNARQYKTLLIVAVNCRNLASFKEFSSLKFSSRFANSKAIFAFSPRLFKLMSRSKSAAALSKSRVCGYKLPRLKYVAARAVWSFS
jgi:hypothetical protein